MNYFEAHPAAGRTVFDPRSVRQPMPMSAPTGWPMSSPTPDVSRLIAEGVLKPIFDGLSTAAKNLSESMSSGAGSWGMGGSGAPWAQTPASGPQPSYGPGMYKHPPCGCGCGCHHERWRCASDACHCRCCIADADLIVYARLGETRVIPLSLENRWRRERKITTELSTWTTRGGQPTPVTGRLLPPAPEFTLPACGQQTLTLLLETGRMSGETGATDVDDCTVAYGDLRIQGCDIRPIRIAVAVLPRDCEAYEIECGCQCCC